MADASWRLEIHRKAEKEIQRLPKEIIRRIVPAIMSLAVEPRPLGSGPVKGKNLSKIRVGNYRVIYRIDEQERLVTILRVGHRKDVYRSL
ncbi:MAG TPA: type II toxin-antitoxin system RelE/ParE family toxin [Chloroflexi bacterium]|nr:type II toxin-antitoxin system RelE/ParE family toxin [Chloroflexota bacterium]